MAFRSKLLSLAFILGIIFPCFAETIDYTNPPLNFQTQDGTVSTFPYRFVVPNGSLTDTATGTILGFTTNGPAGFLKLDQSTPQSITGGAPIFNAGLSSAGQITSTLAIGTAPLVVTSTTQVANFYASRAALADVATQVSTTTKADNVTYYLPFVGANSSSNQGINVGPITINPSTSTITATNFAGNASTATSATSATTATNATNTAITDDTATNATMYPTWVTANTGNLPQKVSSSKLTFNPSNGNLTIGTLLLTGVTSDPSSPVNGQIWYRSDLNQIKVRLNSKTFELVLKG